MTDYEFSNEENLKLERFVKSLYFFSIVLIIAGIATLIDAFTRPELLVEVLISGITWMAFGLTFYFPTDNFKKIIETKGNDIKELIDGFKELKTGFMMVVLILVINRLFNLVQLINLL